MLFGRAIRSKYPDIEVEIWRPECVQREGVYTWQDEYDITHKIFPSYYIRFNMELSISMLSTVRSLPNDGQTYVWVHGIYNLHAYLLAYVLRSMPVIAQSHGGYPARALFSISRHRWLRTVYLPLHLIERTTLPFFPHFFAISKEEKKYLQAYLLVSQQRISFSPTGIDFDYFSPGDQEKSRRICNLYNNTKTVLYVGRLAAEKGIEYLIDAFPKVVKRFEQVRLIIIGSGPLQPKLQAQVVENNLGQYTRFVGYATPDEMPDWYRAADLVVVPSLNEWFGKVVAEAMACGTPVVVTKAGGAIDIVEEFECGLLVSPRSSESLARAIETSLADSVRPAPNIGRARRAFDWSAKLSYAFELFKAMTI